MAEPKVPKSIAAATSLAGMALWAFICFVKADGPASGFTVGLFLFALVPYVFCVLVSTVGAGHPYYGLSGSLGALLGDAITYHSVFVNPTSSTAALGILIAPLVNLLLLVPGGMLLGYALQRIAAKLAAP